MYFRFEEAGADCQFEIVGNVETEAAKHGKVAVGPVHAVEVHRVIEPRVRSLVHFHDRRKAAVDFPMLLEVVELLLQENAKQAANALIGVRAYAEFVVVFRVDVIVRVSSSDHGVRANIGRIKVIRNELVGYGARAGCLKV